MLHVKVEELVALIDTTLCEVSMTEQLSSPVLADSQMGEPAEWDSLAFIAVLTAVAERYQIELADDDAFHFTSVPTMHSFLNEVLEA